MFGAVPVWINNNVAIASLVVLLIVALAVLRMVRKTSTRIILIAVLVGTGVAIYVQRDEIEKCGNSCKCELFNADVEVPGCSPRFPGD